MSSLEDDVAGRGPAPKPAHLRQRTNRKAGHATISAPENPDIPEIPNPDGRAWHPLTLKDWKDACESPMASQWLATDWAGVGRLAVLWDNFYKQPDVETIKEIRLQSPLYGLSPLDRSRLQWEVARGEEAERKRPRAKAPAKPTGDPRKLLRMVSPA